MIKRLALLCCILFLPTIAAAQATTNHGDFWVGGQVGGVFTLDRNVDASFQGQHLGTLDNVSTDPGFSAGAIIGYNFCMPYRQPWERYFGLALDFQWNQFNQSFDRFNINGNQFALTLLGRLQYPLMGSDRFTRGRIVPFLMFGPSVVWSNSDFNNLGNNLRVNNVGGKTSTDFALVAEVGVDFFVCPSVSIGPSFRYRHVFGPTYEEQGFKIDSQLNQFMVMGRLAYHF